MRKLAFLLSFVFGLIPVMASASIIVALPEAELTRASHCIVTGAVIRTETFVNKYQQVFTRADFQVYRGILGAKRGDILSIEVPGGDLPGGYKAVVSGVPELKKGRLFMGFFEKHGSQFRPLGLSYGLLRITTDRDGTLRVHRDLDGLAPVNPKGEPVSRAEVQISGENLNNFIARIERYLKPVEDFTEDFNELPANEGVAR
ncbi:hypothetical protein KAI87_05120 [Myxococcota bacterium]|nr:hypothetical protein [Myxococcota bacterium]